LKEVLRLTGTPLVPLSFPAPAPGASAAWNSVQEALGQKGFLQGKVLWLLTPPLTPGSDPALGFLSLKLQRDGQTLLVLGEAILEDPQASALLKRLARDKMTVTSYRPFSAPRAVHLRWWGSGDDATLVPAIQKIISLTAETPPEEATPEAAAASTDGY
jgi:hypothetical protein